MRRSLRARGAGKGLEAFHVRRALARVRPFGDPPLAKGNVMPALSACRKKPLLLLVGAALLSTAGCALVPAAVSQTEENAAQIAVASAERTICRDLPIGTWLRLYGTSAERLGGWQQLCAHPVAMPAIRISDQ
jgi:hypothetical protein